MVDTNFAGFGEVMGGSAGADRVKGCGFYEGIYSSGCRYSVYGRRISFL